MTARRLVGLMVTLAVAVGGCAALVGDVSPGGRGTAPLGGDGSAADGEPGPNGHPVAAPEGGAARTDGAVADGPPAAATPEAGAAEGGAGAQCAGGPSWIVASSDGGVPDGAVVVETGATPDRSIYVCRLFYTYGTGTYAPGKLFKGYCYAGNGTTETASVPYDVLVGDGCVHWADAPNGAIPQGAVEGGIDGQGNVLWICKSKFGLDAVAGHVGALTGFKCRVSDGNVSRDEPSFSVLVLN